MPAVPLYDQNQLKSSLVGTPGVDNSATSFLNEVSTSASKVSDATQNIQAYEYQQAQMDLRARQAEVKAAANQLNTARRGAEVSGTNSGVSVQLKSVADNLRNRDMFHTDNTVKDFTDQANEIKQRTLDGITDPLTRSQTEKVLNETITSHQNSLDGWAQTRNLPIIESNIKGMEGDLTSNVKDSNATNWLDTHTAMIKYRDNLPLYEAMYGKEGEAKMQAAQDSALKQRIADVANTNPEQIEGIEKNPVVKQFMSPTTFHGFLKDQRIVAAQQLAMQHQQVKDQAMADNMEATSGATGWVNLTTNGNPESISASDFQKFKSSPQWSALKPGQKTTLMAAQAGHEEYMQAEKLKQAKLAAKTQAPVDDHAIVNNFGKQVAHVNNVYNDLQRDFTQTNAKGHRVTDADRTRLAAKFDAFQQAHEAALATSKSVETTEAKAQLLTPVSHLNLNFANVSKMLKNSKSAQAEFNHKAETRSKIGYDNPYSDPQKRAAYNFYYSTHFDIKYAEAVSSGRGQMLHDNVPVKNSSGKMVGAADLLRYQLRKYAATQVEAMGFYHGK